MQLIDFALLGLAAAAPTSYSPNEANICPALDNTQVFSCNQQAYKLECGNWVLADHDQLIKIVTTDLGYQGCLTACDETDGCGVSQYIATDYAQTKGSCTLFKEGVPVQEGTDNSWTVATKIANPKPSNGEIVVPAKDDKFGLITLKHGDPIHTAALRANNGLLTVSGKQEAQCDKPEKDATFYLKGDEAFLYTKSDTPQQLWVDRSGAGQGAIGYTTGAELLPDYAEQKGFALDKDGILTFDGISAKACPPQGDQSKDIGYTLWFTTMEKPGSNEGCFTIGLLAVKSNDPISCVYTSD